MAGYVSSFATGAAIEAALNKANNSQSALNATQLKAVNSGADSAKITQIVTNTDDIAINRAELVELVDNGNKNLLEITAEDKSASGVTFTVDKTAGTVTINSDGTNTASVFFYLRDRADSALKSKLMNKTVVLSGCPEGGSSTTYRLRCWHYDGTNIASDYGEGVEFTFTAEDDYDVTIQVYPGAVMDNVVFKPMICTKAAWDISKEFMPYIPKGSIIDTLWSSSSGANVETEYTMTGNVDDYDIVYVKAGTVADISSDNSYIQSSFLPSLIKESEHLTLECFYHQRYMQLDFNGDKFTVVKAGAYGESSNYIPTLYEVVGIKLAQVSGSGSNKYSETELLASPLTGTISTIPLTDSMDKFDQLVFTFGVTSSAGVERFTQTILVSDINAIDAIIIQGMVYLTKYYGCHYELKKGTDTSLTVVEQGKQGWSEDITIFSIKGIKY